MKKRFLSLMVSTLFAALLAPLQAKEVTIYHSNDLHANVSPFKAPYVDKNRLVGGFANIASLVKAAKKTEGTVFFFDAGDYFTGPYISTLTNGEAVIDIMNEMSIDAATMGNHEFDYGYKNAYDQQRKAKFPILQGNIIYAKTGKAFWAKPYTILKKDGLKIGVIGLHGKFAFFDTVNAARREGIDLKDEVVMLKKYLGEIRKKVDITVLLVHQGVPGRQSSIGTNDVARMLQKDIDMANEVAGLGLDVLITGHAHVDTPEPIKVKDTLIVSTDAYGVNLGKLVLDFNEKTRKIEGYKGKIITVYADEITPDAASLAKIEQWNAKLKAITQQVIGEADGTISRSYGESSPAGNLKSDAILAKVPEAVAVFGNSGGLRTDIASGPILLADVISMFPFVNEIIMMDISGKALRTAMIHATNLTNGILQVSAGVKVEYDSKKPVGERLISFKINGQDVEDDKIYKVAIPSFEAAGGDGFTSFKEGTNLKQVPSTTVADAVIDYIKAAKKIKPSLDKRIMDVSAK